jgi:hypothetical protein
MLQNILTESTKTICITSRSEPIRLRGINKTPEGLFLFLNKDGTMPAGTALFPTKPVSDESSVLGLLVEGLGCLVTANYYSASSVKDRNEIFNRMAASGDYFPCCDFHNIPLQQLCEILSIARKSIKYWTAFKNNTLVICWK